ncbi:hypothetical protein GALMADRAFT_145041 [Galerina marginata CBS 339.88]|uniref:ZZ-type domain-containing protein n=1 Tax=Galerina marginata (strain CBS 339.88) TaxID=685588 RepID=A0A067SQQ9_GALM3|nr:hypothetical protein GALMADRAFT_145041 [Galerina marginata CBS 339.88]
MGSNVQGVTKGSKIDKILDDVQGHPDTVSALKDGVTEMFSVVKGEIGNFVQSSDGLMKALDEVGKLHPFIMIAVIPFKAALSLELKRRENNKKVLALIIQMSSMMETLELLAPIKPSELGSGAESLAQRMDNRLKAAADAIRECSHATHEYYKMKVIPKILKSNKWEEKFTDLATQFANFQSDFAADIAFFTGAGVQATIRAVGQIDEKITMFMTVVFNLFASSEETQLLSFIKTKGGSEKFINDDTLLLDLIKKQKGQQAQPSEDDRIGQGKANFDLGNSPFDDTKKELTTDLNILLDGSRKTFTQLFEEQKDQITAVRDDIRRESDRIVGRLLSGAHDRILDKVGVHSLFATTELTELQHIHAIWVDMGWKGSTKTLDLVLALRDFYVNHPQYLSSLETSRAAAVSSKPRGESDGGKEELEKIGPDRPASDDFDPPAIAPEDAWAIRFLSRSNLSPLMEAVDPDCSGHVTIKEINDFTSSRPREWSLPQWVAYWTVGFEVTLRQYCNRIRELFTVLHALYDMLIPGNAGVFSSVMTQVVEDVIAQVHTIGADDKEDEYQNPSFRAYAKGVEKQIEARLKRLNYLIDGSNALSVVTGPGHGRLEECFLPLVFLLLRNCFRITTKGMSQRLQFSDFNDTVYSFYTLWNAASERVAGLKRDFKLRNISVTDEFRRYSYGMYYYMIAFEALDKDRDHFILPEPDMDPFSSDDEDEDTNSVDPQDSHSADDATMPNYDINSLDYVYAETNSDISESPGDSGPVTLVGTWSGVYFYGFSTSSNADGVMTLMSFQVNDLDAQGMFTGSGSDTLADFSIDGTLDGKTVMFSKNYPRHNALAYSGEINEEFNTIVGKWGSTDSTPLGMFVLEKESVHFYPSEEMDIKKKWRLLWKFAINVTLHRLSPRTIRWSFLKYRRDQRRQFIALFKGSRAVGLNESDAGELKTLQSTLSIADITLYKGLALLEQGREIVHKSTCDACGNDIRMTRFTCLNCSAGRYLHTVDICSDCVNKAFTVTREKGTIILHHLPTHPILQIRRPLSFLLQLPVQENAQYIFHRAPLTSNASDSAGVSCKDCGNRLTQPYWACCECDDVYICESCNTNTEQSRPWLYERIKFPAISPKAENVDRKSIPQEDTVAEHELVGSQGPSMADETDPLSSPIGKPPKKNFVVFTEANNSKDPDSEATIISSTKDDSNSHVDHQLPRIPEATTISKEHKWSHDLVLCASPEAVSVPVSLEGRVMSVEQKLHELQEQAKLLEKGMGKLEGQLERLEQFLRTAVVRG